MQHGNLNRKTTGIKNLMPIKIILKSVTKIPQEITANIVAISSYQEASKIMTKNFAGQELGSGSKKVRVQNVAIWHKNGKMIIALDFIRERKWNHLSIWFP